MTNTQSNIKVAVLCGKGNNGGDGFVVARHLHNYNIAVGVFLVAKISDILKDADAGINLKILLYKELISSFWRGEYHPLKGFCQTENTSSAKNRRLFALSNGMILLLMGNPYAHPQKLTFF